MDRELPHDIDAERSLLGAMLIDKGACEEVLNIAVPDDFYDDGHRLIFEGMKYIHDNHGAIDVTTVTSYLMDHKILDRIGGVDYLLRLSESVPTIAHTEFYLKSLSEKSLLRRLIHEATSIVSRAYDEVGDLNDFINDVERDFLNVTRDRNAGEFKTVENVVKDVTDRLLLLQKNGGLVSGVKTGYTRLDAMTAGFQNSDLIIIAARPSVGKTAFALNIAHNAALRSEEAVAVFSLEMPAEQLVMRLI